jgi:hypothetical protein
MDANDNEHSARLFVKPLAARVPGGVSGFAGGWIDVESRGRARRRVLRCSVAAAAMITLVPVSSARAQCETSTLLEISLVVTTFYYDDRSELPPVPDGWFGPQTWIYEEANGQDDLQRGGRQWLLDAAGHGDLDEDICQESTTPDKLWY